MEEMTDVTVKDRIVAHRSAPDVYDPPTFDQMADRIEELEAKLKAAEAMLECEIRRVQEIQLDFPPPHKVGLCHVEEEYQLMLQELKGDKG
jgi:hypothetical protein